jgi:pteridine reductase
MKLALITGGLRRIGAVIAARLASEGWSLALHCHSGGAPDPDLALALAANGTVWHAFPAELGDGDAVSALIPQIVAHFGAVPDLIVNSASRFVHDDWTSVTPQSLATHQAVNLSAPVLLASALARGLPDGQSAAVINILDQRVKQPNGDHLSYLLSKQGLSEATATLARALAPRVRVNAVAPGLTIPTPDYLPAQMVRLAAAMPLGLLPDPEDVADAVLFLAGARATTGQTIFVDGGANLKSFERDFEFLERE